MRSDWSLFANALSHAVEHHILFASPLLYTTIASKSFSEAVDKLSKDRVAHNLLDYNVVLMPIHTPQHWTCLRVDVQARTVELFDSLRISITQRSLKSLADPVLRFYKGLCDSQDPARDQGRFALTVDAWTLRLTPSPQQSNGSDCGCFVARRMLQELGDSTALEYSQRDMHVRATS